MLQRLSWATSAMLFAVSMTFVAAVRSATPTKAPPQGASSKAAGHKAGSSPAALRRADQERLRAALESGDEAAKLAALKELSSLGTAAGSAAPLVDALLVRGANVPVLLAALETAGSLQQPTSSPHVAPYLQHRRAELRRAAAETLVRTGGPVGARALREGLTSLDPAVRAASATGLATLGTSEAVGDLFKVLSRGTPEAAPTIAVLCTPSQCDEFMDLLGKLRFDTLEGAFVPLLLRPAEALPEANKLRYIEKLRRLATKGAGTCLQTVLAQLPKNASPTLRAALESALRGRPIAEGNL